MKKLVVVLAFVALAACGDGGPNVHAPSMSDHSFTPERLTIAAGEVVKWVNDTDEAHTVTAVEASLPEGAEYFSSGDSGSEDEAMDSLAEQLIEPGEMFEWTFEEPGTYRYYCIPHRADGMVGVVVVE